MDIPLYQDFEKKKILEEKNKDERKDKIITFFSTNKDVTDDMIHKFADTLGIEHSKLENEIYSILVSFLSYGEFNKNPKVKINNKELEAGIKIEMEHTNCIRIAKRIALDHLAELPDYYTRLEKMEKEGKTD